MSIPSSRYFLGLVPWYSLLIALGAGLAIFLADREAKRQELPEGVATDLGLVVLPVGIIGARLYYVLFSWAEYRQDPLAVLRLWEGGLAIYGGLIAGGIAALIFCRRRGLSVWKVLDLLAPGVALAQALGRWGNYFNQEAYGPVITNPAFQFFPMGVQIREGSALVWHGATFFYASVCDLALFCLLMWGRRRIFRRPGVTFGCYAFCYAAGRTVLENLRADSLYLTGGIRVSQLLSLGICLGIIGLLAARAAKKPETRLACLWALPPVILGVPAMLYCLGVRPGRLAALPGQMALLTAFSVSALIAGAMLFFAGRKAAQRG